MIKHKKYECNMSARIGPDIRFKGAVLLLVIWTIAVFAVGVSQHRSPSCHYKLYQNLQTGQKVIACVVGERPYKEPAGD